MRSESDISKKLRIESYSQILLNLEMYYGNALKDMNVIPNIITSRNMFNNYEKYGENKVYSMVKSMLANVLDCFEEPKNRFWNRIKDERKDERSRWILVDTQNIYDCLSYVYWECFTHLEELNRDKRESVEKNSYDDKEIREKLK